MTDNQKFVAGIIIGAAAGAAAAWFLNSEKGKETVSRVKDIADESYSNLKTAATKIGANVESFVEKGKEYVHEFAKKHHDGAPAV